MSTISEGVYFISNKMTGTLMSINSSSSNTGLVGSKYNLSDLDRQLFNVKRIGGDKYLITHVKSGNVVDLQDSNAKDGTPIINYPLHGANNQVWIISSNSNAYTMKSASSNKMVDLSGGGSSDGTPIINYVANGGQNQLWIFNKVAPFVSATKFD